MMTLAQLMETFPDEDACRAHLAKLRWPDGKPRCARCGASERVYKTANPWRWKCKNAKCDPASEKPNQGYCFSLTSGTIFEDTKYPLRTWFQVLYLMLQSKKGMSALQIHRTIGSGSYETAWFMCHRLRAAMKNEEFRKLSGVVEIDETYVGGKEGNKHRNKRLGKGGGTGGKIGVIGAIARKGNVVAQVIDRMDFVTTERFVRQTISEDVSLVASDQEQNYKFMFYGPNARHEAVNHSKGEYVRGQVHTANLDQFWSLLKRGIMGSFHNVSKQYLPLYVNEFAFRHNHRHDPDVFDAVLSSC